MAKQISEMTGEAALNGFDRAMNEGAVRMSIDQRVWWHKGDDARREDERAGNDTAVESDQLGADLGAYFDEDLALLTASEREAALEAAVHGYQHGRPGGYGQPSWLDACAADQGSGARASYEIVATVRGERQDSAEYLGESRGETYTSRELAERVAGELQETAAEFALDPETVYTVQEAA